MRRHTQEDREVKTETEQAESACSVSVFERMEQVPHLPEIQTAGQLIHSLQYRRSVSRMPPSQDRDR